MQEEKNKVRVIGKVVMPIEFSHEVFGERFLKFSIQILRLSGVSDIIPIILSERLLKQKININDFVQIDGQFRSYNDLDDEGKNHLRLNVFVETIEKIDFSCDMNKISLRGFICRQPIYRTTPLDRQIADLLVAVNRSYHKSDYIPCIVWGRNAAFIKDYPIGTEIELEGRIQSRIYNKGTECGKLIEKTAIEVSISKINVLN